GGRLKGAQLRQPGRTGTVPKWERRFPRVLKTLPPELIDYKGLNRFRETTIDWLSKYDDGAPTSPGIYTD
ncbi:hypothetical protein AB9E13_34120, partial [Rhizobium leguminosarum]